MGTKRRILLIALLTVVLCALAWFVCVRMSQFMEERA